MNNDEEHLRLLSTFHYVLGGLTAFFACIPFIHVSIGVAILVGAFGRTNAPPPAVGLLFIFLGGLFILLGWTLAAMLLVAGGHLKRHQSYTFCFTVACISCAFMPLGTVLGVFTITVLSRPSVKALFMAPPLPP